MSDLSGFSMWELFRGEVASQMQVLTDALLSVESGGEAKELLQAAMRAAHSIKGAARIVQLDLAVQLAHAMEDCLVAAQESVLVLDAEAVDLLLACGDALAKTANVEEAAIGAWVEAESASILAFVEQLQALRSGTAHKTSKEEVVAAESVDWSRLAGMSAPVIKPLEGLAPCEPCAEKPVEAPVAKPVASPSAEPSDQSLKVTSEALNRIMSFAGEALVSGRRLETFSQLLLSLTRQQRELSEMLLRLDGLAKGGGDEAAAQLAEALHKHTSIRESLSRYHNELESFALSSLVTSERLYYEVVATRMRPFGDLMAGYPRLIRDLSRQLGKQVRYELQGQGTLVDREIQERLDAPLNHIVRNCLDHGIESPQEREAAGKPATGTLRIDARHLAGQFVVTITDDGYGVDLEKLRGKVVEKGMATEELVRTFSEEELMEFLFLPGFTTTTQVTEISGRGVGLDAVRMMAKSVGGAVHMSSRPGKGSTTTLSLPLTLSVVRTLVAEIGGEPYAFPLTRIDKTLQLEPEALLTMEGHSYFLLDGERIGVVSGHALFDREPTASAEDAISIIVMGGSSERFGLVVDRFVGEQDLVVRPLDRRLGKIQDVSATALLEDGTPVLILDVGDMLLSMQTQIKGGRLRGIRHGQATVQGKRRILVVEDSITVRELERSLLATQGYEVEVAVDGQDGWNALRSGHYDLLVTDVDMPRMTGLQLVARVRADARMQKLPIVIVSYKDREEDRLHGLEAGADRYMTKNSFHDQSWKQTVAELLGDEP